MSFVRKAIRDAGRALSSRTFCYPLFLMAVTAVLVQIFMSTNAFRVVDGTQQTLVYTTELCPADIVSQTDIRPAARFDRILQNGSSGFVELTMERAFPVYVTVDGSTRCLQSSSNVTLDELLIAHDIGLGEYDRVDMSLNQLVRRGDEIIIQRVDQRLVEEEEAIPFEYKTKPTSLLRAGRQKVLQEGQDGVRMLTYAETTVDGKVQQRELVASDVIREPVQQITLVDDGSAISNFDYSSQYPLDASGIPLHYEAVYRNQVATGYYVRNGRGASGMRCSAGTVAVRSDQFPYGTKMYIRTSAGDFIYGYCIANDTGVGLMKNIIDVDLFYDSYVESLLNSRRIVDIYVLEYGSGTTP